MRHTRRSIHLLPRRPVAAHCNRLLQAELASNLPNPTTLTSRSLLALTIQEDASQLFRRKDLILVIWKTFETPRHKLFQEATSSLSRSSGDEQPSDAADACSRRRVCSGAGDPCSPGWELPAKQPYVCSSAIWQDPGLPTSVPTAPGMYFTDRTPFSALLAPYFPLNQLHDLRKRSRKFGLLCAACCMFEHAATSEELSSRIHATHSESLSGCCNQNKLVRKPLPSC